jgi:hypothetical protein
MKLSDATINVLKNFSTINQSLQFKTGNTLRTISPLKTIFAEATITETLTKEFALYDLNKFLAKVSLYNGADLSFDDDRIIIATENKKKLDNIKYCSPQVIAVAPDKSISLGETYCSFLLSEDDLEWMKKSAGISNSPYFIFESDGDVINFIATDPSDDAADQSKIEIGAGDGTKFCVVMKTENIKMMDGSYDVTITKKGAQFKHKNIPITYIIAIESTLSTFGE